jgi:hypothetical protein
MIYELDDDEENWLQGVADMRMVKESPTSSAVHVDTIMGGSPRKRKRVKPDLNDVELVKQAIDKIIQIKIEMRKASFGSRSEAGRYAAEQRWKNNRKKTTAKKPAPKKSVPKKSEAKSKLKGKPTVITQKEWDKIQDNWINRTKNAGWLTQLDISRSIRNYQGDIQNVGYKSINGFLRGTIKNARAKEAALDMQKAFDKSATPLPTDAIVYRGLKLEKPLEVGQVFSDKGFTSTSAKSSMASRFARMKGSKGKKAVLKILAPKGTKVIAAQRFENELIFNSKTKFRVVKASKVGELLEYTVEIIGRGE